MKRLKTITEFQAQLHKTTDVFALIQNADLWDAFTPHVTFDLGSRNRCPVIHLHMIPPQKDNADVTFDLEKEKYIIFLYTDQKAFYSEQSTESDVLNVLRIFENHRTLQGKWVRIRKSKLYPQ